MVIATPAASHFSLASQALEAGKHVFVEKPLATKVTEVDELATLAAKRNLVVMAGHTFIYNSAVRYVKKLIDSGELGELRVHLQPTSESWAYSFRHRRALEFCPARHQYHPILAGQSGADFDWPPGHGLHAGRNRRRCLPEPRISRKDHREHSRELAGPAEGAQDDHCRLPQNGGLR